MRSNLRFVVSVAKKYQNQGVSLADLINEGNLGLIRAAHKFDETKGIKFISYAVWWIRQAILQALAEQSRIVRVPLNRAGTLHRIGKRSSALLQELGREPTPSEIAEGMDISMEEVQKTLSISQNHLSLDAPLPHALARDAEQAADLLERHRLRTVEPEVQAQDLGLALLERATAPPRSTR